MEWTRNEQLMRDKEELVSLFRVIITRRLKEREKEGEKIKRGSNNR